MNYKKFIDEYQNSLKERKRIARRHNKVDGIISCISCDEDLPYGNFDKGLPSLCKMCEKKNNSSNPNRIMVRMGVDMYSSTTKRKQSIDPLSKKEFQVECKRIIISLLEKQNGKCYYSGEILVMERGFDMSFSPERLDETQHYLYPNNTVLIGKIFQSGGHKVSDSNFESDVLYRILNEPSSFPEKPAYISSEMTNRSIYKTQDDVLYVYEEKDKHCRRIHICHKCNFATKAPLAYKKHCLKCNLPQCDYGNVQWSKQKFLDVLSKSREHISEERTSYIDNMIKDAEAYIAALANNVKLPFQTPLIVLLIGHVKCCKYATEIRNTKNRQKMVLVDEKELLVALFNRVKCKRLRCEYTNIPMSLDETHYNWALSVERIDNDITYCESNIKLVCREFNSAQQWKREHFMKFWEIEEEV